MPVKRMRLNKWKNEIYKVREIEILLKYAGWAVCVCWVSGGRKERWERKRGREGERNEIERVGERKGGREDGRLMRERVRINFWVCWMREVTEGKREHVMQRELERGLFDHAG
jgi:hypothetical protein